MAQPPALPVPAQGAEESVETSASPRGSSPRGSPKFSRQQSFGAGAGSGGEAIKVCVRVRPFNSREKELGAQLCVEIGQWEKDLVIVTNPKAPDQRKQFNFDRAYWSHNPSDPHFATQQTLMDEVGDELVEATLEGYNVCFFCYGQTGSGKTFSLLGNKDDPNLRGMLPRVVERLFDRIAEITSGGSGSTITCTVQYYEIYNEAINDLLAKKVEGVEAKKLDVRYHPKTGVNIPGLSDLVASDRGAAMGALEQGMKTRAVSSTAMNAESSRSHCIFSMDVDQLIIKEDGSKKNLRSKVNFVDLAGSERQKKTGAQGDRLKEGVAINQSLSNLAVVISKLAELQGKEAKKGDFIPFRNSKLTFALMDSLSGNSKTVMMAALSPSADNYDETLQCISFAQKVKSIKTKSKKNETLEDEVVRDLRRQLEELREAAKSSTITDEPDDVRAEREEQLQLVQDLLKKEETLKELRNSALQDSGVTSREMMGLLNVDSSTPQLINKSYDPALDGCLFFLLESGKGPLEIGSDERCQIQMPGLEPSMAFVNNQNGSLTIRHEAGRVLLNGRQIGSAEEPMHHGDWLRISYSVVFLVHCPEEAQDNQNSRVKMRRATMMSIQDMEEATEVDDEAYRQFQAHLQVLESSTEIGHFRARVLNRKFKKLLRNISKANAITQLLAPRSRYEWVAELLTDPRAPGGMPECIVRLKKYETGVARWRHVVRHKAMRSKGSKMDSALRLLLEPFTRVALTDGGDGTQTVAEPFRTVALFETEAFEERLQHLQRLQGGLERGEPVDAAAGGGPFSELGPSDVGEVLRREKQLQQELARARQEVERLRRQAAAPQPGGGRLGVLAEASEARLRRQPGGPGGYDPADGSGLQAESFSRDAHLNSLQQQVDAAFSHALAADAQESRALQRHLERVEACASEEFAACSQLHDEARAALRSEVDCLRAELWHAQEQARAELAEQRESSQGALELVEFYLASRRSQESAAAGGSPGGAAEPRPAGRSPGPEPGWPGGGMPPTAGLRPSPAGGPAGGEPRPAAARSLWAGPEPGWPVGGGAPVAGLRPGPASSPGGSELGLAAGRKPAAGPGLGWPGSGPGGGWTAGLLR